MVQSGIEQVILDHGARGDHARDLALDDLGFALLGLFQCLDLIADGDSEIFLDQALDVRVDVVLGHARERDDAILALQRHKRNVERLCSPVFFFFSTEQDRKAIPVYLSASSLYIS